MHRPVAILIAVFLSALPPLSAAPSVTWQCSTNAERWVDKGSLPTTAWDGDQKLYVRIDPSQKFQTISAWGGCFNEQGWDALMALSAEDRQKVLKSLFDPADGLNLNFCRAPIGASDFAMSPYSLDDTKDDYDLSHFSIARDREKLIPYIKAALAVRPDLTLWGVPWSPPGWMKGNDSLINGHIKTDARTMTALANYFVKYVQAYQGEGLPLRVVMPQNEPTSLSNYPTCGWTGAELHDFIRGYMGPAFAAARLNCEIWLGTLCADDYSFVAPTVDDPVSRAMIKGVAFQWSGVKNCARLRAEDPSIPIMQSETICGNGENNWRYAEAQFDEMKAYLEAGVNSYMLWNMVLNETGRSTGNWVQCSPVIVNRTTKAVTYTPQYFIFRHFSFYIRPGATRIGTAGNYGDKIAFQNSNGEQVLEMKNSSDNNLAVALNFGGREIKPVLPAHSMNTFRFSPSAN